MKIGTVQQKLRYNTHHTFYLQKTLQILPMWMGYGMCIASIKKTGAALLNYVIIGWING